MKKLFFIFSFIFSFSSFSSAYEVLRRTTSEGGPNGYEFTSKQLVSYQEIFNGQTVSTTGYVISCSCPGPSSCPMNIAPPTGGGQELDIDGLKAEELLGYSIDQIEANDLTGTESISVHVSGENFNRIYTIVWVSDDSIMTNSVITVSVQYVSI